MFTGDVPFKLSANPSLKSLSLSGNQLSGNIDQALYSKFTNLTWLELSHGNNFSSEWELNSLLSNLTNLEYLDLSYSGSSVTTNNATNHANHNLKYIYLASCKLKEFPLFLRYMRNLEDLDLSSNEINGNIPIWAGEIGGDGHLISLNLSHNLITRLPQFRWYGLKYLYLRSNQIRGPFPSSICNLSNLSLLDLSKNNIRGVIPQCLGNITSSLLDLNLNSNQLEGLLPTSICNTSRLYVLNLSNNSFRGVIPQCFGNITTLELMNLSNNIFQGTIPNTFENCENLQGIILKGNRLYGELPTSFFNSNFLSVLDLENNHLNGTFPYWLGGLSYLRVLNLKSNMFHGGIATSSTFELPFTNLQVLDLSHNRFVGQLPSKYFQNFKAMKHVESSSSAETEHFRYLKLSSEYYSIDVSVKGMERNFPQIFVEYTIICLSNNNFEGKIPDIIGSLNSLIVLDLSHNSLTGRVPQDLGNLAAIESLDLSWNQLTGEIPQSLAELTDLEFLNLSQNHLVGRIPTGKQFNTFEGNSFGGNTNLCGVPLPKRCNENPHEPHLDGDGDDDENGFTWKVVILGYGCGTLFGFVIGYLMLSSGRPKWFNAIADAGERMILTLQKRRRRIVYIGR